MPCLCGSAPAVKNATLESGNDTTHERGQNQSAPDRFSPLPKIVCSDSKHLEIWQRNLLSTPPTTSTILHPGSCWWERVCTTGIQASVAPEMIPAWSRGALRPRVEPVRPRSVPEYRDGAWAGSGQGRKRRRRMAARQIIKIDPAWLPCAASHNGQTRKRAWRRRSAPLPSPPVGEGA
jgi:hypothetical protein